jgi:hypothetical protein
MFANTLSKLSTHHASYMTRFYNRKLTSVGSIIGASCGLVYLSEYYGKRTWNDAANKWNDIVDQSETKIEVKRVTFGVFEFTEIESDKEFEERQKNIKLLKLTKYSNPFSMVINPRAPVSLNIFTTTITGGVLGYMFALYWPIAIPLTIGYNLVTFRESD